MEYNKIRYPLPSRLTLTEEIENNRKETAHVVSVFVHFLWVPDEYWGVEVLSVISFSVADKVVSVWSECWA